MNITVSEMQGAQEDEVIKLKRNMLFKNKIKIKTERINGVRIAYLKGNESNLLVTPRILINTLKLTLKSTNILATSYFDSISVLNIFILL